MITLRLFEAANPFQQVGEYKISGGDLVVGRDPACHWAIDDKHGDMSRRHCIFSLRDGVIHLTDTSANGVRLGAERRPAPRDGAVRLALGETVHLGQYMILVDGAGIEGPSLPLAAEQAVAPPVDHGGPLTDAILLEHFCHAAGLEPSSLAGEDARAVMTRLGAAYRQIVDDLCDLMRDRAMLKHDLNLDGTTISARDNNPLKWVGSERVAVELLQEDQNGFLKGAEAFRASFGDLRRHGDGLAASSRAAIAEVLRTLDPQNMEATLKRQPLAFISRHEALWKQFHERHAALRLEFDRRAPGRIEDAMRRGYAAPLDETQKGDAA